MNSQSKILMNRNELKWLREFAEQNNADLDALIKRRESGEPLQYILGEWEFYGYNFKVGKGVLIPRPETEFLVDVASRHARYRREAAGADAPMLVYDLCAGSGCVGIALAKEIGCKVKAVELSDEAIYYLRQNIELNNVENLVEVIQGDILDPDFVNSLIVNCQLSIVNCLVNPPYLSKDEMNDLQLEVTHEPKIALFGGEDGLDFYRNIFRLWGGVLKQGGLFACEVGDGQAEAVYEMMERIGLSPKIMKDYSGFERIVYTTR